jgi:Raf kinase inhibitor-like YbhB/YbcL family protein
VWFVTGVLVLVATAAACNDDGRTLRPATPEQNASVSTTAPTTEPPTIPAGEEGAGAGIPVVPTVPPTATTTPPSDTGVPVLIAPWGDLGAIDPRFTCDGENVSPTLSWTAPPVGTVEIAITVTDDDAPGFVHWALAGLDPLSTALGEGRVPQFAIEAVNSGGTRGYTGPCPPAGEVHSYHYTVYFLGRQTEVRDGSPAEDLLAWLRANAFDSASVVGTYSRT